MAASSVVERFDVFEHGGLQLVPRGPGAAVDELLLEGREERLGDGVVVGVAAGADRDLDPCVVGGAPERKADVLPTTGRVAVITGASSGIGEATARALAASGHRVALLARRLDRIRTLAEEIGPGAVAIEADVTDRDSIVAAAQRV